MGDSAFGLWPFIVDFVCCSSHQKFLAPLVKVLEGASSLNSKENVGLSMLWKIVLAN